MPRINEKTILIFMGKFLISWLDTIKSKNRILELSSLFCRLLSQRTSNKRISRLMVTHSFSNCIEYNGITFLRSHNKTGSENSEIGQIRKHFRTYFRA